MSSQFTTFNQHSVNQNFIDKKKRQKKYKIKRDEESQSDSNHKTVISRQIQIGLSPKKKLSCQIRTKREKPPPSSVFPPPPSMRPEKRKQVRGVMTPSLVKIEI